MGPVEYGSAEERDRERARGERALMVCKRLGSKREGLRAFLGPRRTSSTGHYSKCSKAYVFHCTTSEWSLFEMLQVPGHCSRDEQARLVTVRNVRIVFKCHFIFVLFDLFGQIFVRANHGYSRLVHGLLLALSRLVTVNPLLVTVGNG